MYRIRLPSGREAEFPTIEELALALRRGDVSREALIYHRRTDQWVPIEQHPRFQGQVEPDEPEAPPRPTPAESQAPPRPTPAEPQTPSRPTPVEPAAPERSARSGDSTPPTSPQPPRPVEPAARDAAPKDSPKQVAAPTPTEPDPAPRPVAPTPPPPTTPPSSRIHAAPPVAPTPYPVRPPPARQAPPPPPPLTPRPVAPDATRVAAHGDEEPRGRGRGLLGRLTRLLFFAALLAAGYFAWQRWGDRLLAGRSGTAPGFEAAPPPSTLLREDPADSTQATPAAPVSRAARPDPRAPVGVDELIARHAATFAASREQLASEMTTIGFPSVFGPVSFASPLGARAARRRIASALNVIGQFHRRSVLLDQAYGDTASFQASRAWSAADRQRWNTRPTLREPYASADLAESLLADADSLLAILGNAPQFELREDTVAFGDPVRAAAYDAQRRRFLERIGPPVEDFDRRPTLFLVRRSLDPTRPPAPLP
ncbi:MAG TPA: hypothetical protein VFZ13_04180 [Gemmatimonadales bacterium]